MASKVKKSRQKKYFLIVTALVLFIVGVPLFLSLSQKPQNDQQVLQAAGANVSIIDFQFSPATITVAAGTTVTWTNMSASGAMHTTSSDSQTAAEHWDSGLTTKGTTFSHTFTTPGTYTYHCNVHTFMRGTVVVTAAGQAPTATSVPAAPTATSAPAAPTATTVPQPTNITPTLVCVGGNGTPPCATIPPTQPITSPGNPTAIPTLSVGQPTPPPTGNGSGNQTLISLLLQFILLILKLLQGLSGH